MLLSLWEPALNLTINDSLFPTYAYTFPSSFILFYFFSLWHLSPIIVCNCILCYLTPQSRVWDPHWQVFLFSFYLFCLLVYPQQLNSPWRVISSVQFSCSVVSDSLQPHELQHTRPPCPSPTPRVYSNSCPLSQSCHPTISSSVVPFSPCLQSFPASGSIQMSQLFASGGQSTGISPLA